MSEHTYAQSVLIHEALHQAWRRGVLAMQLVRSARALGPLDETLERYAREAEERYHEVFPQQRKEAA